ncbi:class I adenylate-forming enzyme family protein [Aeromicrobium wangtongii]|uniref:class I adenylate-forming enzyme family protein n=1 Tax=Aeromicrobium wangtongii TaxID=2969247 RepID=UPI002018171C|nr:AMP-binding protein [Aeromicrobium wangtongii]MCL3818614.1 AMP-binding protein [Aeromicrobium wangtongii]
MDIGSLVRASARRFGDAHALDCDGRTLTFAEFDAATDRIGSSLLANGLDPGDRVGVMMPNGIEGLVVYYALAKAGLVRVPLNEKDTAETMTFKLEDADCRGLVHDGPVPTDAPALVHVGDAEWIDRTAWTGASAPCSELRHPEAPYRLGYTGGTTGVPKAVCLTMRGEHAELANFLIDLMPDLRPGDTMLHAAPIIHASGAFFLPTLVRGARNRIMTKFDASTWLEELERTQAAYTFLVPTMLALALDEPNVTDVDATALRRLCWGASPISPSVAAEAEETFGQVLAQTYGQSEAPMTISVLQPHEHDRVGSAGRPYTLVDVAVMDEDDNPLAAGEIGEVVTRGQHLMKEYWKRPELTAETIRDGWLHTGDLGYVDDEGFLFLVDRKNDLIISGGSNVYPREVEDALTSHPAVREAAVVGIPDDTWGELIHAVVALRSAAEVDELLEHARQSLPRYARPRSLEIWDDLPKSPAGKILRRTVRDVEVERRAAPSA